MMDYSSFSTLNFSVGKLLAGRYEIVRQLRADETSIELLVRDKIADDQLAVLKLYSKSDPGENGENTGGEDFPRRPAMVGTGGSGLFYEAVALPDHTLDLNYQTQSMINLRAQPASDRQFSADNQAPIGFNFERPAQSKVERPKQSRLSGIQAVLKLKNSLRAKVRAPS